MRKNTQDIPLAFKLFQCLCRSIMTGDNMKSNAEFEATIDDT
jgi:hypothetical protein